MILRDAVVVQQKAFKSLQIRESTQLPQIIVAEVNRVELIERCSHVLNFWKFVS